MQFQVASVDLVIAGGMSGRYTLPGGNSCKVKFADSEQKSDWPNSALTYTGALVRYEHA